MYVYAVCRYVCRLNVSMYYTGGIPRLEAGKDPERGERIDERNAISMSMSMERGNPVTTDVHAIPCHATPYNPPYRQGSYGRG